MKHLLNLLTRKDFSALFWAQVSGVMNDNLIRTALTALIAANILTAHNGQNFKSIVTMIVVYMLPFFIFSILAGQIGDKYDKTKVTRIIKFTEVFTVLIATLGFYLNSASILFFTLFIMGTQSAFFGPIKYALMTQILHKNELIAATTQNQLIAKIAKNNFFDWFALDKFFHVLLKILGVIFRVFASGFRGVNRRVIK